MHKPNCLPFLSFLALLMPLTASAGSDALVDLLAIPGSAGLGRHAAQRAVALRRGRGQQ